MHEKTQDAMTYVRKYGRPDLFITFTCNPSWPETKNELMRGQTSQNRHDLLARVFRLKFKKLMELLIRLEIGNPRARGFDKNQRHINAADTVLEHFDTSLPVEMRCLRDSFGNCFVSHVC